MSDVSIENRVYANKQFYSVDMAEMMDAAIFKSGIIQGCAISISSGVLRIGKGRIVIRGRLGVVTGGDIPVPSGTADGNYTVAATCELQNGTISIGFYNDTDFQALVNSADSVADTFNSEGGIAYVKLGTVHIDGSDGSVSDWTAFDSTKARGDALKSELTAAQTDITNLKNVVNSTLFLRRYHIYDNITIAKDGGLSAGDVVVNVSGYKAIALLGWDVLDASQGGTNKNWIVTGRVTLFQKNGNDQITYYLWNQNTAAAAKVKLSFGVLYAREDLVS